jgi:hypothetical protein
MKSSGFVIALVTGLIACKSGEGGEQRAGAEPASDPISIEPLAPTNTTINEFFARGTPTFVLGTAGDPRSDRAIAGQVELVRGLFFTTATVVNDGAIDIDAGPSAWPNNPVVYGGPQVNSLIAALELPFELGPGRLRIGDRALEGDGYQLIAVVPAGPRNPEFLLYAGTGTPGIAEINAVPHGPEPLLIIDAFGRLASGRWVEQELELGDWAPRIEWRSHELARARISFPKQLEPDADELEIVDAVSRGIATAIDRLGVGGPLSVDVYVYPDLRSKQSLTGSPSDGHATPMARALHLLRFDPTPGGALEQLVVHEATHLLTHERWGPAGTPLLGEGVAVYIAGQYGGVALEQWAERLEAAPPITELLGPGFRSRPEAEVYPIAGLLVAAAVELVGIEQVREHLYGATAPTWADACERAGASADAIERALAHKLGQ